MELKGQDKESSLSYDPPNRESSSKICSNPNNFPLGSARDHQIGHTNTIFNQAQTLDHEPLYHPQNLQKHSNIPRRDPEPHPDPVPPQISGTSALSAPSAGGSTLKSPPPPPLPSQPHPAAAAPSSVIITPPVRYRECLKNHVATTGGHVVDGCGEFMPSGEDGTPEAMKCAACECHRNFHRKEIDGQSPYTSNCYYTYNNHNKINGQRHSIPCVTPQIQAPPPPIPTHQLHRFSHGVSTNPLTAAIPPMTMMAFGGSGGAPAESSSEDLNIFESNTGVRIPGHAPKKRFRTKFSQEQKDKMMEFAEKLEWKIQRQDEQEVQKFCSQAGVKRQVFKVWMHNNKQAMKKKQM